MLLIRLLAIFLVLIANTWLVSPDGSDALRSYKRAMARRADRELSRLASEPCTVSGVSRSRWKHRPLAVSPRTRASRSVPYTLKSAPSVCVGADRFDTDGSHQAGVGKSWGDTESVVVGAMDEYVKQLDKRSITEERQSHSVSRAATQHARMFSLKDEGQTVSPPGQSTRRSRSRFTRSHHSTVSYEEKSNSSWHKEVFSGSSTDPERLHKRQQDEGDQQFTTGTPEVGSDEDYSGEVEEVDTPATHTASNSAPWGSSVPKVPDSWMTTLYFGGRQEHLRLKPTAELELPRGNFSLELWVKPEGGQSNPAVIAGQ